MFNKELLESISDFFGDIYYSGRRFFRNLKRSWDFAVFGWGNYDWDDAYLYELILFKLKRMDYALKNGVAEHDKKTLQSLRICIKLLEKINKHDPYYYFTDLHYAKWGQPEFISHSPDSNGLSYLEIKHKNVITDQDKEQERQEILEAYRKDQEQEIRDIKLLFDIMAKYSKSWWD